MDTELLKQIGLHVKNARLEKELSRREVATACNPENTRVAQIEQGRVNIPIQRWWNRRNNLRVKPREILTMNNAKIEVAEFTV